MVNIYEFLLLFELLFAIQLSIDDLDVIWHRTWNHRIICQWFKQKSSRDAPHKLNYEQMDREDCKKRSKHNMNITAWGLEDRALIMTQFRQLGNRTPISHFDPFLFFFNPRDQHATSKVLTKTREWCNLNHSSTIKSVMGVTSRLQVSWYSSFLIRFIPFATSKCQF